MEKMSWLQLVTLSMALSLVTPNNTNPSKSTKEELTVLAERWAPLVWLHPEEVFFPSSVDFHFKHVEVRDEDEVVLQSAPDRWTVLEGPDTQSSHLNTKPDLECPDCLLDWFAGQNVNEVSVPTYVFIRDYQDSCNTVDIAYRAFYPYNYGKDVCVGVNLGGVCEGVMASFGNHVGDWEHFSVRLRNGEPVECYVSVHNFGAHYLWNTTSGNFQLRPGENGRIDLTDPTYPEVVEMAENHPEVFSANGSHGLWSMPGTHEYMHFPIHLQDQAERGYAWRTWLDLEVVVYDDEAIYDGDLHYLNYRGIWGNLKSGCEVEVVSGECVLVGGPGYWPQGPEDFPDDCKEP